MEKTGQSQNKYKKSAAEVSIPEILEEREGQIKI